jgi:hypothetical protein
LLEPFIPSTLGPMLTQQRLLSATPDHRSFSD